MKYERGFKRIFLVAATSWVLFWGSIALLWLTGSPKDTDKAILFGVVAAMTPLVAYLLLFRITPWVVRGFKD